jgi:hypothetical protein
MGKYTAQQFITAIPGTGGVKTAIADRVGCDWHTADKYIAEYPTVAQAYEDECNRVTDKAKHNIIKAVHGGDLQTSKWYLSVKDPEFMPKQRVDQKTDGKMEIVVTYEDRRNDTETA